MRRVLLALCVVTSLLAITSPARADVTGPPVLNAPVFNDPTADSGVAGVPSAAQSAVMDQLIRLIKATPQGAEIRFVNHQFSPASGRARSPTSSSPRTSAACRSRSSSTAWRTAPTTPSPPPSPPRSAPPSPRAPG
ncbi:hypothetical protein ACFQ0B_00365 [Nonomuraea thailandensis]